MPIPFLPEPAAAATDLITFLKAIPDCRKRRGIRFPQWWMRLVAILAILSGQGSLVGMERFALAAGFSAGVASPADTQPAAGY
jgi:hypothetical protein